MKKQIVKILFPLVMVSLGGLVGYSAVYLFMPTPEGALVTPLFFKLMVFPVLLLVIFCVIAIHELGHVAAGLLMDFEFKLITVGPFMVQKEGTSVQFKWNKNLNIAGGLALCIPKTTDNITRKFMFFAAGGPLASLLLAVFAYLLTWAISYDNQIFIRFMFHVFFSMVAIFSLAIFLLTVLPMKSGGFYTDGARILNLWRGGYQAKIEAVLLQVTSQLFAGTRPKQIDILPIQEAVEYPIDAPFKAYLHAFLYYHYLDIHLIEQAEIHLEKYASYLEEIPEGYRAMVWLEKAYFEATYQNDSEIARDFFQHAKIGAIIPKSLVLRVEAAIAKAEKNYDLAIQKTQEALKELPNAMDRGTAVAEKEWLENTLKDLQLKINV